MKLGKLNSTTFYALGVFCLALATSARAADGLPPNEDTDCDGMPDHLEQDLLEKYRPWLYLDDGETFWPCSATWFVQHSRLIHTPGGDIGQPILQDNPRIILQYASPPCNPLKLDIADRGAASQKTEVISINAKVIDVDENAERYLVSVQFTGVIRVQDEMQDEPFAEIWNLMKSRTGSGGWVLSGIQQAS